MRHVQSRSPQVCVESSFVPRARAASLATVSPSRMALRAHTPTEQDLAELGNARVETGLWCPLDELPLLGWS